MCKEIERAELETAWKCLVDNGIATDDELRLVTKIYGYNYETLCDVLYVRTGYNDILDFVLEYRNMSKN